jgi:histidinol-phosphate phosphatase family protein
VLLIVVTNQSGLARGYFTDADFHAMQASLRRRLRSAGVRLDAAYHCPHHPDGAVASLSVTCRCRKPEPGMLLRAARDHDVDLARSWMVGDFASDVEAGRRAGCRTALVDRSARPAPTGPAVCPDVTARTTAEALWHVVGTLDHGSGPC